MIAALFLPEKFRHKRILAQRILGLSIQDDEIKAALIYAKRGGTIIESLASYAIETETGETIAQKTTAALRKCIAQMPRFDQVCISIPSSLIIFKSLQIPFIDQEKIRMVLDYEVESMLPFAIDDALIDFIVTKENTEQQTSHVLVAAIRKSDLQDVLTLYNDAGIDPNCISVDFFALYGLYQNISEYKNISSGCAFIDLSLNATRIAFLYSGELRLTRNIQRGITTLAKHISEEINEPISNVYARLFSSGLNFNGTESFDIAANRHIMSLFNDIQFTLNSFSMKLNDYQGVQKILLVGKGLEIKHMAEVASNALQIPCEPFDCKKILQEKGVKNAIKNPPALWSPFSLALGATLPSPILDDFNLRRKEFARTHDALMNKQIVCALLLIIFGLGILSVRGYLEVAHLSAIAEKTESKEMIPLKKIIPPNKMPKKITLQNLVKEAGKAIQEKTELWAPFIKERLLPNEILDELTKIIDKKKVDVNVTLVSIVTKEHGVPIIEIEGIFKPPPGKPLWESFTEFKTRFDISPLLTFAGEPPNQWDESIAEERSIRFNTKLKPKDKEQ